MAVKNPSTRPPLLIADDDPGLVHLIKKRLERAGFKTAAVHSGGEAIAWIEKNPELLLILDYRLPDMTGQQVIERLAELGRKVPFIVTTGYGDEKVAVDLMKLGARDYLVKDTGFLALVLPVVENVVNQIHMEKKLIEAETALRESVQRFRGLAQTATDAIITINNLGEIIFFNQGAERIFGYQAGEVTGQSMEILMPVEFRKKHRASMKSYLDNRLPRILWSTVELEGLRQNGEVFPIALSLSEVRVGGEVTFTGIIRDITERKRSEERLEHMATHDPLTGLPNRSLFHDRLSHALSKAKRNQTRLAVLFLDLDNFKSINDAFSHNSGDQLLKDVAFRMQECLRESDTIARMGGDEFSILLEELLQPGDAALVAEKILRTLGEPFTIDQNEVYVTTSIGISIYPSEVSDAKTLTQNADSAMYYSKEKGKNMYHFFSKEMAVAALEKLSLGNELRHALERGELFLNYQPQVDYNTHKIIGVEALLRWQHSKRGLIPPEKFIPLAEETGLIIPIGEWVLREACQQCKRWHAAGFSHLRVAVNLSERQFHQKQIDKTIAKTLEETGLAPEFLELELTENIVFKNFSGSQKLLVKLKKMGIRLSVDDFGTGYSTLNQLARFPFDALKIDRSFSPTVTMSSGENQAAIVTGIISIAKDLGMDIIAEAVETSEQLAFYQSKGCRFVQGWIFSRALPAVEIESLLKSFHSG